MDWIADYIIDELKARVQALEKVMQDDEVSFGYKMAKAEEIKFLKNELQDINEIMMEEVKQFEELEEETRSLRADAYF